MQYIYSDFVNREEQLALLHQAVLRLNWRIVLIAGRKGIGKTTLLSEFQAEAAGFDLSLVYVDLAQRLNEPGYWSVITQITGQLGWQGFQRLVHIQDEIENYMRIPVAGSRGAVRPVSVQSTGASRSGGIDFSASVYAPGAVFAGRDINYLIQFGDPKEQGSAREQLTSSFKNDLLEYSQRRTVILILDHWEMANNETGMWLTEHLVRWSLQDHGLRAVLIIASKAWPDWYLRRADIASVEITKLSDEAVRTYWQKQGLPDEKLSQPVSLYGLPELLVLYANEVSIELKHSRV